MAGFNLDAWHIFEHCKFENMEQPMEGQADRQTDRRTDGWIDKQTNGGMDGQVCLPLLRCRTVDILVGRHGPAIVG